MAGGIGPSNPLVFSVEGQLGTNPAEGSGRHDGDRCIPSSRALASFQRLPMLLELRKHDGAMEEIEVLRGGFAREIATAFDWDAERRRFEQLEVSGGECYLPCIAFTDNAGRTLEFGPNSDDSFWVAYRYAILKSSFGFFPVSHQVEQQLEACAMDAALELLESHYLGKHADIVAALPAEIPRDTGSAGDSDPNPPVHFGP
jgi:hypothetical protein